jgi:CDP-diacylglycerol--glycerol-3-phosphate 3-phosphatidyltransferase
LKERFWTIPNILSLYRILVFPYIFYLVLAGQERLFAVFITISLLTDILDGWIARRFKLQTAIGARLDSWADLGTYILAFMAIYYFKWEEIRPHALIFYLFAAAMALSYVSVIVKFGGLIGLHTYMFRIGAICRAGLSLCCSCGDLKHRFFTSAWDGAYWPAWSR